MKIVSALLLLGVLLTGASAQRPRTTESQPEEKAQAPVAPAPKTVKAKYEGGIFGYTKTMQGTSMRSITSGFFAPKKCSPASRCWPSIMRNPDFGSSRFPMAS